MCVCVVSCVENVAYTYINQISCVYFLAACVFWLPSLNLSLLHQTFVSVTDYDPQVIEQKEQSRPACLPLSYVLRFITDAARKEGPFLGTSGAELKRKLAIKHHSYSMTSSNRSLSPTGKDAWACAQFLCVVSHLIHVLTPHPHRRFCTDLGSEMDEDEMLVSESEDSNDSWTTEEFSSEFIMRYGSRLIPQNRSKNIKWNNSVAIESTLIFINYRLCFFVRFFRHSGPVGNSSSNEKPFACPVPGCKKRYKNVNGIKYHSKNGHKKDGKWVDTTIIFYYVYNSYIYIFRVACFFNLLG